MSFLADDDLEVDEADIQKNGTLEHCHFAAACSVVLALTVAIGRLACRRFGDVAHVANVQLSFEY
jgi:hypothetical protein